ncbi:NUDIX hydrolase [Fictibacillus enclensis]|uniref:NUDIX hydrolase n=1 Tax=Fictibacillus enclensis TaxID=1017270 RepID=UPI0024C0937F|nr:NUDIX domain-containing protein [Fictibacillus enclensis]WHY71580.1 NUDIX domain-containing protein [Fictibacillus enclensis]
METWDVYDKRRNKTNKLHVRGDSLADGEYHIVVHVWIKNDKGEILLAKRHEDKHFPNLWECPGGSVLAGETSLQGALREVKEEIGITLSRSNGRLLKSERRDHFQDFCDVWLFHQSFDLRATNLQKDEVIDIKWVTEAEMDSMFEFHCMVPVLDYYKSMQW